MTTSGGSWAGKLRKIGDLERADHWHLSDDDECVFFGEYTSGGGYAHSATNDIVSNLKKSPSVRNTAQWRFKQRAIEKVAATISANLRADVMKGVVVVPIPPSKPPEHALYDDRMAQVARLISPPVDVRELLYTAAEREPRHMQAGKRDPASLRESIKVRLHLLNPVPDMVLLIDDVLTTGCSFKVCKTIIAEHWPNAPVLGLFVARRVIEETDTSLWLDIPESAN